MRSHYIIDSAATLLGVALVIVTGVHSKSDMRFETLADKAFAVGLVLLTCGVLSFWF